MPLVTVHAALMRTGELLLFDAWEMPGTPSARLWNPTTNVYTAVPNGFAELFCSGHILTNDGRLATVGGHNGAAVGTTDATLFDPITRQWTAIADLNYARWYPSLIQLADGRLMTVGGAISRPAVAEIPETFTIGASNWNPMSTQRDVGEYPPLFQAPNGRVFVASTRAFGEDPGSLGSFLLNTATGNWTSLGQGPSTAGVAVMYRPGKVMMTGGGTNGADPVHGRTGVIDLTVASPSWRETESMTYGRSQHNLVILPDGKVLVVGGAADVSLSTTTGVRPSEIWDPDTETWTTVAAATRPRMYHSIAILVPDGRVLSSGGGRLAPDELNGEFYSPPYLFNGPRPTVNSAPGSVPYGSWFTVGTPAPGDVAKVTMVRASSVTHTMNLDQRYLELPFSVGSGQISVQAPAGASVAPPGFYMLFVLNDAGVPSLGRILRVGATGQPTLEISDVNINEGASGTTNAVFSVAMNGTSSQTVRVDYTTVDGSATADSDYLGRSGTLTYSPGTTVATIAVPIVGDADAEANESFRVQLSNPVNATLSNTSATGLIINDDFTTTPTIAIDSVSVLEGSGTGTPVASFTVSLSIASPSSALVSYQTVPGTATSPADYQSTTGVLTFAGGSTTQTIQVPIVPDTIGEPNETFTVQLSAPVNAVIGAGTGTATIVNDDFAVQTSTFVIAAGVDDVNEDGSTLTTDADQLWVGSAASGATSRLGLRFTNVSIPPGATITQARLEIEAVTSQWSALAFEYAAEASVNSAAFSTASRPSQRSLLPPRVSHSSDVQWPAGQKVRLDDITPLVQAVIAQGGWQSGNALGLVMRGASTPWSRKFFAARERGTSQAPRLIVTYSTVGAGNAPPSITSVAATPASGVAPLAVTFSASATDPEGAPLSYAWSFGDGGSATGANVSHTYAAGSYTATLTVSDGALQTVSGPLPIQATVAATPTFAVNDVSVTEGTGAGGSAVFTVTLAGATGGTVTVAYQTVGGTATAPADFTATSGTLSFSGATTARTVTVQVAGDSAAEGTETFALQLSTPTGGAVIGDGLSAATIVDDDAGGGGPVTSTYIAAEDANEDGGNYTPALSPGWVGTGETAGAGYLGLRFTGVAIPVGATVTAARLEVTSPTSQWSALEFEMAAEAAANSAPFSSTARPSQRTRLAPRVAHSSDAQWAAGSRIALDDITTLVQAVVQQPAWAPGQALTVILRGAGGAWARKSVASVESGAASAPRLVVTYTNGAGGDPNQPPVITSATATPTTGTAPLTVNFAAAATDPEGAALSYTWTFGDGATALGPTATHTYNTAGTYPAAVSVSDGTLVTGSAPVAISVGGGGGGGGTTTASYVVSSGADDVNEDGASFTPGGSLVWLGSGQNPAASYLGLRFTGVVVPPGATVTSARLEVTSLTTQWNQLAFEMAAEASTSSAPFTTTARPSQRVLLGPRVPHDSDAPWVAGVVALEDISTLVQAVVAQPGWAAGRPLTLVLRGTGGAWARKQVASAEGGAAAAPRLVVTYTVP